MTLNGIMTAVVMAVAVIITDDDCNWPAVWLILMFVLLSADVHCLCPVCSLSSAASCHLL